MVKNLEGTRDTDEFKRKLSHFIRELRSPSPYGSLMLSCKNWYSNHKLDDLVLGE